MPRYLHIPHTPDTARTLTLSGRNCLAVSGIVTPPKIGYRRGKGRRGEMCPQGTQKSHSGAAACLVAYLCVHVPHIALPARGNALDVPHIALPACGKAPDVPHIALPAHGKAPRCTPQRTIF
jgi:hypothetical protein